MLAADTEEPTLAAPAAPAGAVPAAVEPQTAAPVSTPAAVPSAAGYPAGEAAKAPVAPAHAAAADTARTVAETSAAPIAAADTTAALATAVGETTADGEVPTAAETSPSSESGAEAASVDLPAAAQAGLYGRLKEKAAPVVQRVAEMESVQKATQYVVDTSKVMHQKVSESERIQQSVDFVRRKTAELAESERVQKGIEVAKETAKVVSEKTAQGLEVAKERTKAMRQSAGAVWQQGRGSISKVRANVSAIAWKGSARDTLDIAARDEMWTNMRVQGAEELVVPARTEHTSAYHVSKGSTLRWTFRVKEHDVGFGVRMRVQEWGGSREDEVLAVERYDCADTISGSWVADEDRTIILAFDNRYSRLRLKTVAYLVGTEKPPVFTEPAPFDTAPVSTPAAGPPSEPAVRAIV
mmetsp:Transcript_38236/g.121782  ORF Transcript_38236/g.121782 Transcript_38236/m.121782 type:complete len:411 (+) Transcript_38236:88-1320(+)